MNPAVAELDRRIAELEAKLASMRRVREKLVADAELGEFAGSLIASPDGSGSSAVPRRYGSPLVDQVVAYFESESNRWQTARDIADATGLSRNSINGLFYTSKHRKIFETELRGQKRRVFRLKRPEDEPQAEPQPQPEADPHYPTADGKRPKNRPAGYPKDKPWPPGLQPQWGPIGEKKDTPSS